MARFAVRRRPELRPHHLRIEFALERRRRRLRPGRLHAADHLLRHDADVHVDIFEQLALPSASCGSASRPTTRT